MRPEEAEDKIADLQEQLDSQKLLTEWHRLRADNAAEQVTHLLSQKPNVLQEVPLLPVQSIESQTLLPGEQAT